MINAIQKTQKLKGKLSEANIEGIVYLFGSHAKNKAKSWSDIDVAIISDKFNDYQKNRREVEGIAAKIDYNFEIHLFKTEDFDNPYDPLVSEVKKYGILV